METLIMKKILFSLTLLAVLICPGFASESWIGITTGPAFELSNSDDLKAFTDGKSFVTDYSWDVNVEGACYFNEAETMGIGVRLGIGVNYGSSEDFSYTLMGFSVPFDENPIAGTRIASAVTFQYRLGLTDALDLRLGAGLQYTHVFGNGAPENPLAEGPDVRLASEFSTDILEVIASADAAYSLGDFQIFAGFDLGVSVLNRQVIKASTPLLPDPLMNEDKFIEGFQMSITPRIGVSYAF